jgi:hypothetical protein
MTAGLVVGIVLGVMALCAFVNWLYDMRDTCAACGTPLYHGWCPCCHGGQSAI